MNDKTIFRLIVIGCVLITILCFTIGFIVGRRADRVKIKDAEGTISNLESTIGDLNETIRTTKLENSRLEELHKADGESIKRLTELLEQQRNIISEIETRNIEITESGDAITKGIGNAIDTVDEIIKGIEQKDD